MIAVLLILAVLGFLGWVCYSIGYDEGYLAGLDAAHPLADDAPAPDASP